mmetsp:Transcript_1097/g.2389  ORF Transcript_1097/g.2389 Transcript_1097/m.2389 type:complete len:241 (+) Transcript_1097:1214-1936(+)
MISAIENISKGFCMVMTPNQYCFVKIFSFSYNTSKRNTTWSMSALWVSKVAHSFLNMRSFLSHWPYPPRIPGGFVQTPYFMASCARVPTEMNGIAWKPSCCPISAWVNSGHQLVPNACVFSAFLDLLSLQTRSVLTSLSSLYTMKRDITPEIASAQASERGSLAKRLSASVMLAAVGEKIMLTGMSGFKVLTSTLRMPANSPRRALVNFLITSSTSSSVDLGNAVGIGAAHFKTSKEMPP